MAAMQSRDFARPDETRTFDRGLLELVTLGGLTFGRGTFQPGWRWSTSVKPLARTSSCEAPHLQYHVSGRLQVVMGDGTEAEFGPGEVSLLPPATTPGWWGTSLSWSSTSAGWWTTPGRHDRRRPSVARWFHG
jgi:hypothetical protein